MTTLDTRDNAITEKVAEFSEVGLKLLQATSPGDTTTDAIAAAAQKVVSVASETNFAVDEYAMMDEGNRIEILDLEVVAAGQLDAKSKLWKAHASGVVVKELVDVVLGDVMEDGFADELNIVMNLHNVGTKHGAWDSTPGHHEQALSFQVVHATLENLKLAHGLADSARQRHGHRCGPVHPRLRSRAVRQGPAAVVALPQGSHPLRLREGRVP